ncbi:hypothetical protein DYH10_02925 [Candidatus Saccharibacteria bacterium CPR2]|nr:hypothetical protein [Candidatus Saccharibacteria bacterium CPR2]
MHTIQKKIYKLAQKEDIGAYGYRKIGEKIKVEHPQQVKHHVLKLINDGYLVRTPGGGLRASKPNIAGGKMLRIPILGQANCGEALSYAEDYAQDWLSLSPSLVKSKHPKKLFAVKASGDSMNKAVINGKTIEDGDYVIVDGSTQIPENGDFIVSSVEGLANIKKYMLDQQYGVIALLSESTRQRPPIFIHPNDVESYHIHGKVVEVIKNRF